MAKKAVGKSRVKSEAGQVTPEAEAALSELLAHAQEHRRSGERRAKAGQQHERSCTAVCRCVVQLERRLTSKQKAALFDEAVRRGLLSRVSRGDAVTKLTRLACGAGESKSVVSRIAAVARHLAEPGRDVESVLPESARFWAVYEELRPTFAVRRGKAAAEPPLSIRLEDGFLERIRAGAAGTLRVAWDLAAARPVVTEIVVGEPGGRANSPHQASESGGGGRDGEVDGPSFGVAVPTAEDHRRQLQGSESADEVEPVASEGEGGEGPPPPGTADGVSQPPPDNGGERPLEPADGASEMSVDRPPAKAEAAAGEPDPPPLVIAFAAYVAAKDPAGFRKLETYGRFKETAVDGRMRAVWTGRPFDGLDALVSAHGGRHVGP
ncbi:MAG: hypothetical protein ICV73_17195 [Acetobacteraceae bacterium]|nr:hypothetical protein [Acetobacteraceae bacterium]